MLNLNTFKLFVEKSRQEEAAFFLGQGLPCPEVPHLPVVPHEKKSAAGLFPSPFLSIVLPQKVSFEILF